MLRQLIASARRAPERARLLLVTCSVATAVAACTDEPTQPATLTPRHPAFTTASGAVLSVTPMSKDYGSVVLNQSSDAQTFTVENVGTDTLYLTDIAIDGPNASDFKAATRPEPGCSFGGEVGWAAGSPCYIGLKFVPSDTGKRTATLTIKTAIETKVVQLTGTGLPTPATIDASAWSLTFDDQGVGIQSAPKMIRFTNTGMQDLVLTGYEITRGASDFQFMIDTSTCQSAVPVKPGAWCDIPILFKPSAVGARTGRFALYSNAGAAYIALSGNGVAAADLAVSLTGALKGKSIDYTIALRNAGPNDASSVQLVTDVPAGTTFADITAPSDMQCAAPALGEGGTITCTMESLASGGSRTIKFSVKPAVGTKGTVQSTTNVTAATIDPTTSNNVATASTKASRR
jgi:uncharacterized repeat protein (TIGR01451 family)